MEIIDLLRNGNVALAELRLRKSLEVDPTNPTNLYLLGWIADCVNFPSFAEKYFGDARRWAMERPELQDALTEVAAQLENCRVRWLVSRRPRSKVLANAQRFLLIKAWGCGFWSDVNHVLGQLLIAEITGRIPVVHWGRNSLFGDGTDANVFERYFQPVSSFSIKDLQHGEFTFWPPKWNRRNLLACDNNKWHGEYSRIAGLYLLGRRELVAVSDFHTGIVELKPWIPVDHPLYGLSVDDLYIHLVRRYLRPSDDVLAKVENFFLKHLASLHFLAVHVRGSDKVDEVSNLDELNKSYDPLIDQCLAAGGCDRIFLMTDDSTVLDHFTKRYGQMLVVTDSHRTASARGLHFDGAFDGSRLGTEVMVDTYLAARAHAFIGNAFSNCSLMVRYLRDWPDQSIYLLGRNVHHELNPFLHQRPAT